MISYRRPDMPILTLRAFKLMDRNGVLSLKRSVSSCNVELRHFCPLRIQKNLWYTYH